MNKFTHCVHCKQPFTKDNVYTPAGARETQISGMCEKCFDALFADEVDGPEDEADLDDPGDSHSPRPETPYLYDDQYGNTRWSDTQARYPERG